MNPSRHPQVLRSRSLSSPPVSRARVGSSSEKRTSKPKRVRSELEDMGPSKFERRRIVRAYMKANDYDGLSVPLSLRLQLPSSDYPDNDSSSDCKAEVPVVSKKRHRDYRTGSNRKTATTDSPYLRTWSENECTGQGWENMANVETVSAHHSINCTYAEAHPRMRSIDLEDGDADNTVGPTTSAGTTDDGQSHSGAKNGDGYGSTENKPGTSSSSGSWSEEQVEQLRCRLKFFFMDPWSKFKARKHLPWKLLIQFLKIVLITVQLVQFGHQRSNIVEYFQHNEMSLRHQMLKNWDPSYETMPYPPATGTYALYRADDLLDYIDYAWAQYYELPKNSVAVVSLITDEKNGTVIPMRLCNRFNNYRTYSNGSFVVGRGVIHNCTDLNPLEGKQPYNIRTFLKEKNITIPFRKLLDLTLDFSLDTFHLNLIESHYGPTCYRMDVTILFQNYERSGQMVITLSSKANERSCAGKIMSPGAKKEEDDVKRKYIGVDAGVISMCVISFVLCLRSLVRAWKLKQLTESLFKERFGEQLVFADSMEFYSFWYFLLLINDTITIAGASLKIQMDSRAVSITSNNYDTCSLMLGIGGLLAWVGILRYLSFFKKYNILLLTLKTAFPHVLRFSVCALAMYCGFMFCGWVVLGPYHIKFRHISTVSECLFSLVNGDDMFVTFSATQTNSLMVWYFSRVYLYIFISLFIYCVLSLCISVIMDTYDTLKECYVEGFPTTALQRFIAECNHPLHSGLYRRQHTEDGASDWSFIETVSKFWSKLRRKKKREEDEEEERSLLSQTV